VSDAFPKSITVEAVQAADAVVLLGDVTAPAIDPPAAADAEFPRPRIERWDVPDLENQPDEVVRAALDEIDIRVLKLLAELLSARRPVTEPTGSSARDR
jgi:arsenate reductase (thioredoxin)